jgi:hypothetical protein
MIKLEIDCFEAYIDTVMEGFLVYKNIIRINNLYNYNYLYKNKYLFIFLPNTIRF